MATLSATSLCPVNAPGLRLLNKSSPKSAAVVRGATKTARPTNLRVVAASSSSAGGAAGGAARSPQAAESGSHQPARGDRTTTHAIADPGVDVTTKKLRSGRRVSEWWKQGPKLDNMHEVHSADEFVAYLHEAANIDKRNGRARLVCVKFFAGWCPGCRSLFPKMQKIAQKEYPDVLFLKVHMDALPDLCASLGVSKLPWIQMYKGSEGLVEQFSVSMSAKGLAKLRLYLDHHRGGETGYLEDQHGPATLVAADSWPVLYSSKQRAIRQKVGQFYKRYLSRARPDPLAEAANNVATTAATAPAENEGEQSKQGDK